MPRKYRSRSERKQWEDALDEIVRLIVRCRDDWRCIYPGCGKQYLPPTKSVQCSHYFHRSDRGTRWDLKNCDTLCYGHHRFVEGNKQGWYRTWKLKQLGQKEFDFLEIKAHSIAQFSVIDLQFLYQEYVPIADRYRKEFQSKYGRLPDAHP